MTPTRRSFTDESNRETVRLAKQQEIEALLREVAKVKTDLDERLALLITPMNG